jgi:heme-degrading monooxygenase HmoA
MYVTRWGAGRIRSWEEVWEWGICAEKGGKRNMISRIWHGWTTPGNANKYEALLQQEIFVGIRNRHIRGFKGIQLLRREVGGQVEFVTIMLFDSLDAVREFAGEDYEVAVVPEKARAVLSHFDERSQHYEIRAEKRGERQNGG